MSDILTISTPSFPRGVVSAFTRVCVTSDIFKIDDRQADPLSNPQRIKIDWLEQLVGRLIGDAFGGLRTCKQYGDDGGASSPRLSFYRWRDEFGGLKVPQENGCARPSRRMHSSSSWSQNWLLRTTC